MKKICLSLAIVGLMTAGTSAATQSFSSAFGPTAVGSSTSTSLPQFDNLGGSLTLQAVTLTLTSDTDSGSISWDNNAGSASDVTLGIGAEVTATAPNALAVTVIPLQTNSANVGADSDGTTADFIGSDAFEVTGGSGTDSDAAALTDPPDDLSAYIGTGNFDVNMSSAVETLLSTTGGFGPIDPTPGSYNGNVTVEYDYIPEPASVALMGLSGLALLARRRR